MKVFSLERTQILPVSLEEAWSFFSSPTNLEAITPKQLKFQILHELESPMYAGQIIHYKIRPLLNIPIRWTTEITHVENLSYFVDEQRSGPYQFWHHKHFFEACPEGVKMRDLVHYALPLGFLGDIARVLYVQGELNRIFDFRYEALDTYFKNQ